MAIISSSSEFTRGSGVTWDDGFIWKSSEGLVGGLGMRMDHWAGTAAGTGSSSTTRSKKNRRQLRSTVNISNPLSSSSTTDPTTTTIITVPVSGGSSAGVGAGVEAEADVYVSCFKSSSARFFGTVRNCGLLVVGYFLWVILSSVGKGKMARSNKKTKKNAHTLGKKFRALRWKLWMWACLVVSTPKVFLTELWFNYSLATYYSEEHFEGINSRGVGGITLTPVDVMKEDGGRVVERGRGRGSGGGKKASKPSFGDQVWKSVDNMLGDVKLKLRAFIAWVWCLICGLFSGLLSGLAYVYEVGGSFASQISGVADLTSSEGDNDSSHQESDAESSGENGKDKKAPKKADNAGAQRGKGKNQRKKRKKR